MTNPLLNPTSEESEYFTVYEEHSKVLRTWLVAYGIGAPALFLTNERIAGLISAAGVGRRMAGLFLLGVALQVLLAALNKTVMWACYYAEGSPNDQEKRRFRLAYWISEQFWIDFLVDIVSLIGFGYATWLAFNIAL